jgi:hypothetical protein
VKIKTLDTLFISELDNRSNSEIYAEGYQILENYFAGSIIPRKYEDVISSLKNGKIFNPNSTDKDAVRISNKWISGASTLLRSTDIRLGTDPNRFSIVKRLGLSHPKLCNSFREIDFDNWLTTIIPHEVEHFQAALSLGRWAGIFKFEFILSNDQITFTPYTEIFPLATFTSLSLLRHDLKFITCSVEEYSEHDMKVLENMDVVLDF